jgi:hypothetical protein
LQFFWSQNPDIFIQPPVTSHIWYKLTCKNQGFQCSVDLQPTLLG